MARLRSTDNVEPAARQRRRAKVAETQACSPEGSRRTRRRSCEPTREGLRKEGGLGQAHPRGLPPPHPRWGNLPRRSGATECQDPSPLSLRRLRADSAALSLATGHRGPDVVPPAWSVTWPCERSPQHSAPLMSIGHGRANFALTVTASHQVGCLRRSTHVGSGYLLKGTLSHRRRPSTWWSPTSRRRRAESCRSWVRVRDGRMPDSGRRPRTRCR